MFKKLTLKDKETYLKYYNPSDYPHSQYNYTTVYIWRNYLDTHWDIIDNNFCFLNRPGEKSVFASFPIGTGDPNGAIDKLTEIMGSESRIFCVTPQMYDRIDNKDRFKISDARYNFDYVYETDKLINLSGKKLHAKKNHLNKFLSLYPSYSFEPINKSNIDKCMDITNLWFANKYSEKNDYAKNEYNSITDILKNMDFFNCCGIILYVNGKPAAYSVGERMSKDTALIHIEKADASIEGSYAMINNLMCKNLFSDTIYINREEDMGMENLRRAKMSYRPHHMVEVMNLHLKNK